MSLRTKILTGLAVIFIALAGSAAYVQYGAAPQAHIEETRTFDVTLTVAGVYPRSTVSVTETTTALQLLRESSRSSGFAVSEKEYAGLGTLVERIGDFQNGDGGKYWTYYVNESFAPVGADAYVLQPGDAIEWRFELPPQE